MSKKILALALAFAFAFSFTAKAVTIEEIQTQIEQLRLLLNQLLGAQTPSSEMYCFNSDLEYKMTSPEVKNLQIVLNKDPNTRVAVSGAGSPGQETNYFGSLTLAAVKKFQAANAVPTTGYVGPLTRAALNAKYCVPPTTTITVPPESTTTTTTVAPSYGTLSVVSYPVSNPQTTWYGANTYEVVAGQYKATGSDITMKKVAVKITSDTATAFPWQAFTTISLWDGATKLAELPVVSANAIETIFAQIYTFNISGFNLIVPNGQQKVLTVKMTTVANPPTAVTTTGFWKFELLTDVVYTDTAGVTYSTVTGSAITLDNVTLTSSQSATLTVTSATDNPLENNVIGSTSATTKVDVLKFNLKDENVNSTLTSGTIKVTVDGTIIKDEYVTSLELWDGATLIAAAAPSGWASHVGTSTWTNFSLPISAGTTKTLTVKAVLAQLPSNYANNGTGYLQITTGPILTGIDANSNVVSNSTTVAGNKMYPFLVAPTFAYVSKSVTVRGTNSETHPQDIGDTALTFSVTANGGDIYIPEKTNTSVTIGMYETLTKSSSTATTTTSTTWTCNSPAVEDTTLGAGKYLWRIPSGSTANCTFSTLLTNTDSIAGYFRVALGGVKWYTSASATSTLFISQNWGLTNINTGDFYLGI